MWRHVCSIRCLIVVLVLVCLAAGCLFDSASRGKSTEPTGPRTVPEFLDQDRPSW